MIRSSRRMPMSSMAVLSLALLISACGSNSRKEQVEHAVQIIYADPSQPVVTADELVSRYQQDRPSYKETFGNRSIFITGNIHRIDMDHKEVLLENAAAVDVVCLVDDSATLQLLRSSDKVLFKGICRSVGSDNLILIADCVLAQLKK